MSKAKKVLIIILVVLVACAIGAAVTCYFLMQERTVAFFKTVWEMLNKPLPLVGVSSIVLGCFLIKLFSMSGLGKSSIKKIREEFEVTKEEVASVEKLLEEHKEEIIAWLEKYKKELGYTEQKINDMCSAIPNKKVKAIGVKKYGEEREETINSESETEKV